MCLVLIWTEKASGLFRPLSNHDNSLLVILAIGWEANCLGGKKTGEELFSVAKTTEWGIVRERNCLWFIDLHVVFCRQLHPEPIGRGEWRGRWTVDDPSTDPCRNPEHALWETQYGPSGTGLDTQSIYMCMLIMAPFRNTWVQMFRHMPEVQVSVTTPVFTIKLCRKMV